MEAEQIIAALQIELQRHTWDTYVDNPPSVAPWGKGVVVPGCPVCRIRINTMSQFVQHLSRDVIPAVVLDVLR